MLKSRRQRMEARHLRARKGVFLGTIKSERFFGRQREDDVVYNDERCVTMFAPAGANKSMAVAVPTLLQDVHTSHVVTDLSGELFALTSEHRAKYGRVIALCPWASDMSRRLNMEVVDAGLNLWSSIDRAGSPDYIKDEVALRAALLLPGNAKMDEKFTFFRDHGREVIEAFSLNRFACEETPTLASIRREIKASPDLNEVFASMAAVDDFGGLLAEYGRSLGLTMNMAGEQFMGCVSTATQALSCYDSFGPMAAHVQGCFDPRTLKDDVPTTVYIIWPGERLHTHQSPLNTTISFLIEMVARDPRLKTVRFLLDEVFNCGYLGNLLRAMAQYRKQGVQCVLFGQATSQGERLYGREGFKDIMNNSDIIAVTGMIEYESLKLLSSMAGETSFCDVALHDNSQLADPVSHLSQGRSNRSKPLLRPEEIRRLRESEMLIFFRNLQPIRCTKVPYWTRPSFAAVAGKHPFYRG